MAAGRMKNRAHGIWCSSAIGQTQFCAKSSMIQSGFLENPVVSPSPPVTGQAPATRSANGAARPSNAFLRSSTFSGGTSAVDSAPSGRPSTSGRSSVTTRTRGDSSVGTAASLVAFRGVDTNVTAWPRRTSRLESSRKGIMWPNASHGNTTTWRGEDSCLVSAMAGSWIGSWIPSEF
uniref:Uncharacterized protein n=1 Tax=Arundo donax TaxID=35708 RepID=A0A0A9HI77_ARUDO